MNFSYNLGKQVSVLVDGVQSGNPALWDQLNNNKKKARVCRSIINVMLVKFLDCKDILLRNLYNAVR